MATLKQATDEIIDDLSKTDKLPRFIGAALHSETLDRIFTNGIASDGAKIGTYDPKTISLKKSKGRFTSTSVNLRDTDTLANSYTFTTKGKIVELGFRGVSKNGVSNTEKINNLESQYGSLFCLTKSEDKLIDDLTDDFFDEIL